MKVLVVGGGGREHAICWKLSQSPHVTRLYCAPGNGGIESIAQCVPIAATDVDGMVKWAKSHAMDFVVVAPDDPLALGMVDAMEAAGIPAFGPTADAAIIEASKIFSKNLMKKYNIPTAKYETFTDMDAALAYVEEQGAPIVVKADGLALGKGVIVAQTVEEAKETVRSMMSDHRFGDAGAKIVIEECMTGPEVTVLAFCDGEHILCMPSSQDHKRAYDGNQGPNTGGMGAISPSPNYTAAVAIQCMRDIFLPTVAALKAEGRPFKGVIYFGLMITPEGPKVVEYNARFGDPECQAVLSLLDSDLMEIFAACREGELNKMDIRWKPAAAWCWPPAATPAATRRATPSPAWMRLARPPWCSTLAPNWMKTAILSPTAAVFWPSPPWLIPWIRPLTGPMPRQSTSTSRICTSALTSGGYKTYTTGTPRHSRGIPSC